MEQIIITSIVCFTVIVCTYLMTNKGTRKLELTIKEAPKKGNK